MLIDDLIVLGRAVPEPLRDGRVTVCLAGWSEKLGFVRLYPTRHDMQFRRWDIIKVPVEKNNRDTREESWKIAGSRDEWDTLTAKVEKVGRLDSNEGQRNLIGNLCDPSVTYINDQRRSLGIIHPYVIQTYFRDNPKYGQLYQQGLPGFTQLGSVQVKRDFPDEPRVKYTCPDGNEPDKRHDQQILEWGFYEWLRKNPDNKEQVWENAQFNREDTDIYFLIGNQAAHRNSFMVISVLRFPRGEITRSMFPLRRWVRDIE